MAKRKGKISKREGNNIGHPNAVIKKVEVSKTIPTKTIIPAPLTYPDEATTSYPESNNDVGPSEVREEDGEKTNCISGFIFMCNPSTKLDCYKYRVFGLPFWQKEMVEKIKPGAKLFLYDFGLRLLYGVYMATSAGELNLEPAAFSGKYPAQVKFKIFKECLPLPESSLRHVIKENYTGSKFNQELSEKQVKKLLSSFPPLFGSSYMRVPQTLENVSLSRAMPPSEIHNQFKHRAMMEVPYIPEIQYNRTRPLVESQAVPMHQGYYRAAPPYVENVYPSLDHQSLPSTSSYPIASSQRPSFPGGVNHVVQEPPYSRYRTMEERGPCGEVERQYLHQLPLQRGREIGAVYQGNSMQTLVVPAAAPPPHRHQLPSQHYKDSITAYGSSTAHAPYITGSVSEPCVPQYVPAYTYSDADAAAQYPCASVSQPYIPAYTHSDAAAAQYPCASVSQPYVPAYTHSDAAAAQYPCASVSQPYIPAYTHSDAAAAQYPCASVSQPYVPAYTYSDAPVSQPYVYEYVPASDATVTAKYTSASATTQWQQAGVAPHAPIAQYTSASATTQWPQVGVAPHAPVTSYYSYPQ